MLIIDRPDFREGGAAINCIQAIRRAHSQASENDVAGVNSVMSCADYSRWVKLRDPLLVDISQGFPRVAGPAHSLRGDFQPNDCNHQQDQKEDPSGIDGLAQINDPQHNCAEGADADPDRIGRSDRKRSS